MSLTFQELFANPDHFPFAFDGDDVLFRPMDPAAYLRSIFLDGRIQPAGEGVLRVPTVALLDAAPSVVSPPINWIFHVAHCGSTLLSRALETLVLREPAILRQLAVSRSGHAGWHEALRMVMALLGRRYAGTPTVKANVPVNFILDDIVALQPGARAILLHFGLEDYLAAILRSNEHRAWLRMVTDEMRTSIEASAGAFGEADAERAAALWLAQLLAFATHAHFASLDAAVLLAEPKRAVAAAAAYFDVPVEDNLGSLLGADAKRPGEAFSAEAREHRQSLLRESLADEMRVAREWIAVAPAASSLPARLANPLIEGGKPLLE